jgi:pyruvate kinase
MVARELGVPMIGNVTLPRRVSDGDIVTLDAQRGVVYEEAVTRGRE